MFLFSRNMAIVQNGWGFSSLSIQLCSLVPSRFLMTAMSSCTGQVESGSWHRTDIKNMVSLLTTAHIIYEGGKAKSHSHSWWNNDAFVFFVETSTLQFVVFSIRNLELLGKN